MLIRRMRAMRFERKWAAVVLDLTVVVVGIVLAFQVDRWNESRKDRQLERIYLERLRADLVTETQQFEEIVIRTGHRLGQIRLLDEAIGRPESVALRPEEFAFALEQVTWPITTRSSRKHDAWDSAKTTRIGSGMQPSGFFRPVT